MIPKPIQIIESYTNVKPKAAIILGSGLGPLPIHLTIKLKFPQPKFQDIPGQL